MPKRSHVTNASLDAVHHYLDRAFPNQVMHTGWDADTEGPVFEVVYNQVRHQVVINAAFLKKCPDHADILRHSELADYIREVRTQSRRFLVLWQDGALRVRSVPQL
jgi:hypothetical protein